MSEPTRGSILKWLALIMPLVIVTGVITWRFLEKNALPPIVRQDSNPALLASAGTCVTCHGESSGFSPFHKPETIGCVSCHLGNAADSSEDGSHRGMIAVPGNLNTANVTCGQDACHSQIVDRVQTSLMGNARGIVAVNRFVFGEQETPDGTDGFADLRDSHADSHLQQMCSSCHLGYEKSEPSPVTEISRGGGCVACHIQYSENPNEGDHPSLTVQVTNDHCFGCHSRSGRISLNYEGWHETVRRDEDVGDNVTLRRLLDGRILEKQSGDAHHALDLACIDCHTARETMGDGIIYTHQDQAVEITCNTCHRETPPNTLGWDELDDESKKIIFLRYNRTFPERRYLRLEKSGMGLTNVYEETNGELILEGKLNGRFYTLSSPTGACLREGHERLTCQSCHTAWAPQCVGCHTQLDRDGQWREFISDFYADPPVLGVKVENSGESFIDLFVPGMVMTLNKNPHDVTIDVSTLARKGTFHRFYAPTVPHTTAPAGRTCESCHNDPLALGFGRGRLQLQGGDSTQWIFRPAFVLEQDGLPTDAWTGFLRTEPESHVTRQNARQFSRIEQMRILRVGVCLTCHVANEENDRRIYDDFNTALTRLTSYCRVTEVDEAGDGAIPSLLP